MPSGIDITDQNSRNKYLKECMTYGGTVGSQPSAKQKSLKDLKTYLKKVFFTSN